jgi:Mg-chelatase subunit ChlD
VRRALLLAAVACASCGGPPGPRLAELPLRSPEACGVSWVGAVTGADVAIAIDTSMSTEQPAGADIDEDGRTGTFDGVMLTDPADSLLAAEVAAVRSLLHSGYLRDTRFSIVSFSGRTRFPMQEPSARLVSAVDGAIRAPLTGEIDTLETSLDEVLARGSLGNTDFAAALQLALRSLDEGPASTPPRRRLVLLMSDSPNPVVALPRQARMISDVHLAYPYTQLATAAHRAVRARIPIDTVGFGEAASAATPNALSRIARVTGGHYRVVHDAARLHCALLAALAPEPTGTGQARDAVPRPAQAPAMRDPSGEP